MQNGVYDYPGSRQSLGISERRIQVLCTNGRLEGATKFGRQWAIPENTEKPDDARIKSGKYIKQDINNK